MVAKRCGLHSPEVCLLVLVMLRTHGVRETCRKMNPRISRGAVGDIRAAAAKPGQVKRWEREVLAYEERRQQRWLRESTSLAWWYPGRPGFRFGR
jgi:hypothetical protein